jgi:hypothetical protein
MCGVDALNKLVETKIKEEHIEQLGISEGIIKKQNAEEFEVIKNV